MSIRKTNTFSQCGLSITEKRFGNNARLGGQKCVHLDSYPESNMDGSGSSPSSSSDVPWELCDCSGRPVVSPVAVPAAAVAGAAAVSTILPSFLMNLVDGRVEVQEDETGEVAKNDELDEVRYGVTPNAAVVNVQGHYGHGRGEGHQTDGHAVIQACGQM